MLLSPELVQIASFIARAIADGLSTEEVLKRLADPSSVGHRMLEHAVARKAAGAAYLKGADGKLKSDPEAIGVAVSASAQRVGELPPKREPKPEGKKDA